jgi:hypothetical protein
MMIDYRAGDDVVCIRDHSQGIVKKGDVFTAVQLARVGCGCVLYVDIGVTSDRPFTRCPACGMNDEKTDNIWWLDARLFRRLLTRSEEEDLADVLAEVFSEELISLN